VQQQLRQHQPAAQHAVVGRLGLGDAQLDLTREQGKSNL